MSEASSLLLWPGTKCLVIGGCGNLGVNIVKLLAERGASVATFDCIDWDGQVQGVESYKGDVCDRQSLEAAMQGVKVVIHTASIIDIRPMPSQRMQQVNVDGTRNVLECCKACGVPVLVYTSSMEVVTGFDAKGEARDYFGGPTDNEDLPVPARHHLVYASTKAKAEALVLSANEALNSSTNGRPPLRTCSLRPGYIVGPNCIGVRLDLINAVKRGDRFVTARMPTKLSCVHGGNCALAHVLAAERALLPDVGGASFFIRDFEANVAEFGIEALSKTDIKIILLPLWLAYLIALILDSVYRLLLRASNLVGASFEIPREVIDIEAVKIGWRNVCFSGQRAEKVLGYGPSAPGFVSPEACRQETQEWARQFYQELKQQGRKTA